MSAAHVHINFTKTHHRKKIRRKCSTCERRTTFYCFHQEWYGWDITCIQCGESWADGERLPRPFAPKWRERNIAAAKARWNAGVTPGELSR